MSISPRTRRSRERAACPRCGTPYFTRFDVCRFRLNRSSLRHDRATKDFRSQVRTRDQENNGGISVRSWILQERGGCRRAGAFCHYMLLEEENPNGIEQFLF